MGIYRRMLGVRLSIHRRDLCRDFADYLLWFPDSGQDVYVLSIRYVDSTDAFVP
jgi:hypothetical protein